MALKYNESTGEFEEKDGSRKPEPKVPPPFIYDPREHTVIPPKQEPREEKTKSEGGCLSTLLGLIGGMIWLALPYLILLGLASLCS